MMGAFTPGVKWLLIATAGMFLLQLFLGRIGIEPWLRLDPSDLLQGRVWQVVTYAFLHADAWHLLFNLLLLYYFGGEVEVLLGTRRFIGFYLGAAVAAGAAFCAWELAGGDVKGVMGASGAVMGVMVLYALHWPRRIVLLFLVLPLPVWLLVVFLILMDMGVAVSGSRANVAHMAHLGGAAYGWLYAHSHSTFARRWRALRGRLQNSRRRRVERDQQRLDRILEKVHDRGMQSLTAPERWFLRRMSRRAGRG